MNSATQQPMVPGTRKVEALILKQIGPMGFFPSQGLKEIWHDKKQLENMTRTLFIYCLALPFLIISPSSEKI